MHLLNRLRPCVNKLERRPRFCSRLSTFSSMVVVCLGGVKCLSISHRHGRSSHLPRESSSGSCEVINIVDGDLTFHTTSVAYKHHPSRAPSLFILLKNRCGRASFQHKTTVHIYIHTHARDKPAIKEYSGGSRRVGHQEATERRNEIFNSPN
jgi:hypothetical protein